MTAPTVVAVVGILVLLDDTAAAIALPTVGRDLHLGLTALEWVVNRHTARCTSETGQSRPLLQLIHETRDSGDVLHAPEAAMVTQPQAAAGKVRSCRVGWRHEEYDLPGRCAPLNPVERLTAHIRTLQ